MRTNALVKLDPGDSIEPALGKLKKLVLKIGLFKEMKKRAYYEKPSKKKKRKHIEALRWQRKHKAKLMARDPLEESRPRRFTS